ncbi:MAG: hypothetical protein Q9182_000374 [Xanthomendoza sp. 2 TL-2023]
MNSTGLFAELTESRVAPAPASQDLQQHCCLREKRDTKSQLLRNICPGISGAGTEAAEHDKSTWPELENLARHHPESGVHFQGRFSFKEQLGSEHDNGHAFTTVCINTAIYLPWLASQCLLKGIVFKRANLNHISDGAKIHHSGRKADVIVNCTGLSARKLGGVEDQNMMPIRGTDDGEEEVSYVMQRAAGGGTLLGGSYQRGNWDSQLDPNLAIRIMKRAVDLCPALTGGKGIEHLDIIRHGVGLRPYRQGGTRIETEKIDGVWTVHNYGHGGFGYQSSYGCSKKVVELVGEAVMPKPNL